MSIKFKKHFLGMWFCIRECVSEQVTTKQNNIKFYFPCAIKRDVQLKRDKNVSSREIL